MVGRMTGALALLAICLEPGALAQDARYISKLHKAAKKGDVAAQYKLGSAYADAYRVDRDYDQAIEWLTKAGDQGHSKAQLFLGRMLYSGVNVDRDPARAADWFEKAARNGDPEAQSLIGNLYNNGEGRPQDFEKAVYWYRMAAEQGDAKAQYNLGVLCHNGEGVERDLVEAFKWISLAAADPPVEYPREYGWARDNMEKSLSQEELDEARRRAAAWRPKSWEKLIEESDYPLIAGDK